MSALKQRLFQLIGRLVPPSDIKDTILIAGTGRSGSTWLGEVLRELKGYKFLNEPYMHTALRKRTYFGIEEDVPVKVEGYTRQALSGKAEELWRWRFRAGTGLGKLAEFVTQQHVVVKFTRALRLLHWLLRCFEVRKTIVLVRHPCAVVGSMLRHGGWNEGHMENRGESTVDRVLGRNLPAELHRRVQSRVTNIEHRYEMLAHLWALDYYCAFFAKDYLSHPWILVPYERLITRQEEEIERIAEGLDVDVNPRMKNRLGIASTSALEDVNTKEPARQLSKWQRQLSDKQIDRILSIVHTYNLTMYTEDTEPDYSSLRPFQAEPHAW